MTTFFPSDEAINVDFVESRRQRDQGRVACFLHLRDLVTCTLKQHRLAPWAFVQKLEAAVIAQKAAREKHWRLCANETVSDRAGEGGQRRRLWQVASPRPCGNGAQIGGKLLAESSGARGNPVEARRPAWERS